MAMEFSGFFDSVAGDERAYDAQDLKLLLSSAVQNGVTSHFGGGLKVGTAGDGMRTTVTPGGVVIDGFIYVLSDDGGDLMTLTHAPSGSADRIDRVVAQLNLNDDRRVITLCVKEGTPAAQPVAPMLMRTAQVYELSLAQVRIPAAAVTLSPEDISDERGDESVCGYAVPVWLSNASLEERFAPAGVITNAQIDTITAG